MCRYPLITWRNFAVFFCLSLFANLAAAANANVTNKYEQIVRSYIAASNARDTETMLRMVVDDVQWLSIDGDTVVKETNNKAELRVGMVEYFKSCGSCKSRLERIFSTHRSVSALEVASFETSSGIQEQQSISVYEFAGDLIRRVYYFPVES